MRSQTGSPSTGELAPIAAAREEASEYRRLLAILSSRAQRLGSRDAEAAAQEAFKRSWENATSQPALAYYFCQNLPAGTGIPAWSLDQLLAWLHIVLKHVVSEERSRVGYRLEISSDGQQGRNGDGAPEPAHQGPNQLQILMQQELDAILEGCFPRLDRQYQTVLKMRGAGMKYEEISVHLGIKENTVATWVSRGIRDLAQCVKRRMHRKHEER